MNHLAVARTPAVVLTWIIAALVFGGLALLIRPLPVPALTALLGGLLGYTFAVHTRLLLATVIGMAIGGGLGAVFHGYLHYVDERLEPEESLGVHIVFDGCTGLIIAGATLMFAIGLGRLLTRSKQTRHR